MSTINVPIINSPDTTLPIMFSTQSEYAVSFEAANPDGTPSHCQTGGPGVVGGPEYVNLLQRGNPSTAQSGYASEQFQLAAYPNYTFYSFKNFTTGVKNVVGFLTSPLTTAATPVAAFTVGSITANANPAHSATGLTASVSAVSNAVSYAWAGSAIGAITAGANTASMTYTAAATTGAKQLQCVVTDALGNVAAATPLTVTLS